MSKVNRLFLELEFSRLETAFRQREGLGQSLSTSLGKAIDELSACIPAGYLAEFEHIEIDIGSIDMLTQGFMLHTEILSLLQKEFGRHEQWIRGMQLKDSFSETDRPGLPPASGSLDEYADVLVSETEDLRLLPEVGSNRAGSNRAGLLPAGAASKGADRETKIRLLLHFFEEGRLPWWAEDTDMDMERCLAELVRSDQPGVAELMARAGPAALNGMAMHLPRSLQHSVYECLRTTLPEKYAGRAFTLHKGLLQIRTSIQQLLNSVSEQVVKQVQLLSDQAASLILKRVVGSMRKRRLLELSMRLTEAPAFQQQLILLLRKRVEAEKIRVLETTLKMEVYTLMDRYVQPASPGSASEGMLLKYKVLKAGEKEFLGTLRAELNETPLFKHFPETGLQLEHAGLVLIAPYLPALFSNLGLLNEKGKFRSAGRASRAVQVLRLLSGAGSARTVNNYPLYRLLAGRELDIPISTHIRLSAAEKKESADLLNAVLENWGALKSSSAASLQHNFFKRRGLLKKETDHYTLQVEKKEYDKLLDSLPWSVSLIRFAWFENYFIEVQW